MEPTLQSITRGRDVTCSCIQNAYVIFFVTLKEASKIITGLTDSYGRAVHGHTDLCENIDVMLLRKLCAECCLLEGPT